MKAIFKIVFTTACLFFAGSAAAQLQLPQDSPADFHFQKSAFFIKNDFSKMPLSKADLRPSAVPKAWKYCDLAFFCKVEVELEKAARMPVKFRLGDVQYVDWLEGKTD